MSFTEPIRDKRYVCALMDYYLQLGQTRNYVLISYGCFYRPAYQ